ncbi:universal stress protein [Saccharothrix obliqua]|uniref:universal stress protein n=1 Tax=Saccharothrix obliqua TaxID=2861747 RepID=UPI001C600F7D|nr:universal stress protein [Saccharothrix obliqua]MBW4716784.1 universal stress protein [Saccharothrix obliqua]
MTWTSEGALVVGVDGTEVSGRAAEWAAREASAAGRSVVLVYGLNVPVHVDTYMPMPVDVESTDSIRRWAEEMLAGVAERCRAAGVADVRAHITPGDPADAVTHAVDHPSCVVVGHAENGGLARFLFGSTANRLTRSCPWPVVVVGERTGGHHLSGPVVVGLDDTAESHEALRFALSYAHAHGAEVDVVHASEEPAAEPVPPAELVAEFPDVPLRARSVRESPADALLHAAAGARLLVVGSRGLGVLRRVLTRSVSHEVVGHATCPVAVLPPETARQQGNPGSD